MKKAVHFSSVFPNPADEFLSVEIYILQNSDVSLELFDKLGNKISHISKGFFKTGNYKFEINTALLPEGTYYIRALSDINTEVWKFIKLRQ